MNIKNTAIAAFFYAAAFFFVWAGFSTAPDNMKWPTNDLEITGCLLIAVGMGSKLMGHVFLLSSARARA